MLEDRRLAVLRAIVEDYVATHEPVGSKALVERHHLGVSPATIRNDMAAPGRRGLHHPPAHVGGPDPYRSRVSVVRRPDLQREADECAPERKAIERDSSGMPSTSTM